METEACRQRDSEGDSSRSSESPGIPCNPPVRAKRGEEGEEEKNPHNFTESPLKRDYEERSCVGQTLPTNSAGLGKGKRDPFGPQKFSEAQLRSSWQQQQQQRELEQRLPSASTMEPGFQACEQLREHVLRILRDKARQTAVFYLYLLPLAAAAAFCGGSANGRASYNANGVARSLAPNALFQKPPKTPREEEEKMGLPSGRNAVPSSGGRADRGTAEHKRGYKPPTTLQGAVQSPKKKKKCHSCFLLRCKETRVKVPSELASWLLT